MSAHSVDANQYTKSPKNNLDTLGSFARLISPRTSDIYSIRLFRLKKGIFIYPTGPHASFYNLKIFIQ